MEDHKQNHPQLENYPLSEIHHKSPQVLEYLNATKLILLLVKREAIPSPSVGFHPSADEKLASSGDAKQLHCHHFLGLSCSPSNFHTGIYPVLEVVSVYNSDLAHHGKATTTVHVISVL